jgi:nucleoside-diphosphate-sugar epimerase
MQPLPADDLNAILGATRPLWEELRDGRLFLTGATGFFGAWLLESFVHANDALGLNAEAVVLTRAPEEFRRKMPHLARQSALRFVRGEVRSFVCAERFTHVIHGASPLARAMSPAEAEEAFDVIVGGTRRVLDLARHSGARKLLYLSSGAVYGRQPPALERIGEDYPGSPAAAEPHFAYGEGKRVAEWLCRQRGLADGITTVAARVFTLIGPHLPLDGPFALGNFVRDALVGKPIIVRGDGTALRSYLYAADLATWLWTLLFAGRPGEAYNVGSEEAVSIAELACLVATEIGDGCPVEIRGTPILGRLPERYVPSTRKAQAELGLTASVSLRDGVRRMAGWLRSSTRMDEIESPRSQAPPGNALPARLCLAGRHAREAEPLA